MFCFICHFYFYFRFPGKYSVIFHQFIFPLIIITMEQQTKTCNREVTANQIWNHPNFKHFIAYALSYTILGAVVTGLGPMFPYLSVNQHRIETEFSFLFICRASGFLTGSMAMRIIGKRLLLHQLIGSGVAIMSLFCLFFGTTSNLYIQGIIVFILSTGCSFQDVCVNLAALICFKGENVSGWLQIIHGTFGIGGLLGPFVVYIFELNSFTFLGICGLLISLFYFYLETPQKLVDMKKQQEEDSKKVPLPNISVNLICAAFLFTIGQQTSYGGWISSYAVLWKFSTKEHATFYSSLYWISTTAFNFIIAGFNGSPTSKIRVLTLVGVATTAIGYFSIFVINPQFGLILMSILFGMCVSGLFPLMIAIPQQFGFELTIKETSLFLLWASLGEGCLTVGVGKFMEWFSYNWLLYGVGLFNLAIYFLITINSNVLTVEKQKIKENGSSKRLTSDQEQIDNPEMSNYQSKNYIQLKPIQK